MSNGAPVADEFTGSICQSRTITRRVERVLSSRATGVLQGTLLEHLAHLAGNSRRRIDDRDARAQYSLDLGSQKRVVSAA